MSRVAAGASTVGMPWGFTTGSASTGGRRRLAGFKSKGCGADL
jgi:hypothetical protein